MNAQKFCMLLKDNDFSFCTGVPCSILSNIIDYMSTNKEFTYIPATREDEAIGIAAGAYMAGRKTTVLMQNSGLGVSINALTSLVLLYKIPMLLIISWRGYLGKDAPQHLFIGRYMLDFLRTMNIPTQVLERDTVEEQLVNALKTMKKQSIPTALILRRGIIE